MSKGADKQLKEFRKIADQVNDQEQTFHSMDDEELRSQTARFWERYDGEPLDDLLQAFAAPGKLRARPLACGTSTCR